MFNKTFYHFFLVFVVIIALAFGVLIVSGSHVEPTAADNLAQPK